VFLGGEGGEAGGENEGQGGSGEEGGDFHRMVHGL
jgi:hypothetical protein